MIVSLWRIGGEAPVTQMPLETYLRILAAANQHGWGPAKHSAGRSGDLKKDFRYYLPPSTVDAIDADFLFETLEKLRPSMKEPELLSAFAQLSADSFRSGFDARLG